MTRFCSLQSPLIAGFDCSIGSLHFCPLYRSVSGASGSRYVSESAL